MGSFKEVCKIAGAFVGVIIGAGFASGQELLQFFVSFGRVGLLGCLVAGVFFAFLSMAFATMGQRLTATSHKEVLHSLLGKYLGMVFDALLTFFLFAVTVVMLAGAGSLLEQWLGAPAVWGSVLATVLTVAIVCLDASRVIAFISGVTPLLMLTTLVIAGYALMNPSLDNATLEATATALPNKAASSWLVAALLYVSYNLVAGMPLLVIMGGQASSRKVALWGGILGGVLLSLLMLMIAAAMYWRIDSLGTLPMPTLALATQISPLLGHLMSLVIFGMILNTAVGVLYAFVSRVMPPASPQFRLGAAVSGALALAGSFVGFISLVGMVYPIYGYIGFALMACALVGWVRTGRNASQAGTSRP